MDRYSRTERVEANADDPEDFLQAIESAVEASEMVDPHIGITLQWEDSDTEWDKSGGDVSVLADARQRMKHSVHPTSVRISASEYPSKASESSVRVSISAMGPNTPIFVSASGTDAFRARRAYEAASRRLKQRAGEQAAVEPRRVDPAVVEPAVVEPAVVEPRIVEPAVVEPPAERGGLIGAIEAHPAVTSLVVGFIGAAALLITKLA